MKYRYILIDAQNFFWRVFAKSLHTFIEVENKNICQISLKNSFEKLDKLLKKFGTKDSELFLLFDNPQSVLTIRKEIFEDYKHIRMNKYSPKGLYDTLKILIHLLQYYSDSYRVAYADKLEADDLTKPIISNLSLEKNDKILIISNDLDWARNIEKDVHWWDYHFTYTISEFKKKYGFSPEGKNIQLYKAIHGDNSDCIPNAVPRLPKDLLLKFVNENNSLEEFLKSIYYIDIPSQWKEKIIEATPQIKINYQLADFIEIDDSIESHIIYGKRNIKMLKFWYDVLNLSYETFMISKESLNKSFLFEKNSYC